MESKKKLLEWFKNNLKDKSEFTLEEFTNACLEISNEAKKEMIDKIEPFVERVIDWHNSEAEKREWLEEWKEEKKRHLSTFANEQKQRKIMRKTYKERMEFEKHNIEPVCSECSKERRRDWQKSNKKTKINIGDYVKILLVDKKNNKEHIWAKIQKTDKARFEGEMYNEPVLVEGYSYGQNIKFKRNDIEQRLTEKELEEIVKPNTRKVNR